MNNFLGFLKKHKKFITNLLTLTVILLMGLYLYRNREVFSNLKNLQIPYLIYIFIVQTIAISIIALTNKKVINILKINIPYKEAFLLQYSNSFLNKIVSEGGAFFRGYFLKEVYKLPYTKYVSTIGGLYIISFLSNSLIGLISLVFIYITRGSVNYWVVIFFIGVLLFTILLLVINPVLKNKKEYRVIKWITSILQGWSEIKRDKKKLLIFVFLSVLGLLMSSLQLILVYRGLGYNVGLFESLYMSSIAIITTFINITPDSIGITEGVYMFSSEIIGLNSDIILLGSLIIRAIGLINTFLIGGISYLRLAPRLKGGNPLEESSK
jgi:uncharacterized protein (TIRG00374 family)